MTLGDQYRPVDLTGALIELRRTRAPLSRTETFYVRYDRSMGGTFAQMWFLTRGCTWDRRGECTMCNYGHASEVSSDEIVSFVDEGLKSIDRPLDELYVSPSGSLLDSREVPESALKRILDLVDSFPVERFSFETRPATFTAKAVEILRERIQSKQITVGFGLESADPWILENCVNKPGAAHEFEAAVALAKSVGIRVASNVSLGTAFLSPGEAVEDAVSTIHWSAGHGADLILVFPLHVKRHTLLEWLWRRGLYEPPSLWSLIEVLERVRPDLLPRVGISWYRGDYGSDPSLATVASPGTCPTCVDQVLAGLDGFRAEPTPASLQRLSTMDCECKVLWQRELTLRPALELPPRIRTAMAQWPSD